MKDELNRRALLTGGAAALTAACASGPTPTSPPSRGRFLWGAATSGHQIEGNNIASDFWTLEHVRPSPFAEPSGDACDSLHRWDEDISIVHQLGLNAYRFSVEWSRIQPEQGCWSQAMLDHYSRMVDVCVSRGIAPVVTLNHFTAPGWFAAAGGWATTSAADLFAAFSEKVSRALADRVSHMVTFNEPNLALGGRWSSSPPGPAYISAIEACVASAARANGSDRFVVLLAHPEPRKLIRNVVAAHVQARAAIRSVRSSLPVGLSLAIPDDVAVVANSVIEAKRADVYGPFLDVMRDDDFAGLQTYGRDYIGTERAIPLPPSAARRPDGREWFPAAVGNAARYLHNATGKPVLITENGIDAADDAERARFIPEAIASVDAARQSGIPIIGYLHWSLLDNFEWLSGYGPKYGLVAVDRTTFRRTIKPSAWRYAEIVSARLT
ncbi:MAG: family 1 glycosylhydrolase [Hyphomonadaceae bacterium]|nr:family 1 glycosylhydrolase [Hyphomonadaceae bacterium]